MSPATERPTVSFELFPPRDVDSAPRLWETIRHLEAARPDFVSVTYGASGATRETTRALVTRILRETSLDPIAHLTCVATSRAEIACVVEEFLDAGVRSFLALRGDPPTPGAGWQAHPDGLRTAAELVTLLRQIESRRCAQSPSQQVRATVRPLSIAVAAFPRGNHGAGSSREQDIQALLDKQSAGADFAVTQLFYDAESYLELVGESRRAGVRIPIIPGIIPATDPARLLRTQELTGVPVPRELLARLEAADDDAARHRLGVRATADLVETVLDGGAPGIHLYTFNRHAAALDVLDAVGLLPGSARPAPVPAPEPDPAPVYTI